MSVQTVLSACSVFTGNWSCVEHHLFSLKQPILSEKNNSVIYRVLWFCLKANTDRVGYVGQLKPAHVFLSPAKANYDQSLVYTSKCWDTSLFKKKNAYFKTRMKMFFILFKGKFDSHSLATVL